MVKAILLICATALFAESALAQCLGLGGIAAPLRAGYGAYGNGLGCGGYGADIAAASSLNAACGGVLGVATGSTVPPTGLNVASENVYEGTVAVGGNLPFLGTVALEGVFPSAGAGAVSYACGDGALGITAETGAPAGIVGPIGGIGYSGLGYNGLGYNGLGYQGIGGRIGGCGCGAIY